jgi:hypothetical protein
MQQTVYQPHPDLSQPDGKRRQSSSIVFIALTLFALAGLMIGFAVGVIAHQKQSVNTTKGTAITVTHPKTSPTATTIQPYELGCPWFVGNFTGTQVADGSTQYTLTAQAKDTSHGNDCPANGPVKVAGITFKLWLIQRFPGKNFRLPDSAKDTFTNIQNPITGIAGNKSFPEISLSFATPQVQQSNSQGQVTWKYTIPASVQPGNYDLIILTDWSGKFYNWSWIELAIQKAGNN